LGPGEKAVKSWRKAALALIVWACVSCPGCVGPPPQRGGLYSQLQSARPTVRAAGVKRAAAAQDTGAIPYLVDRLNDGERGVRLFAIKSLEKLTGRTLGYRHYAPVRERKRAVERWREWLRARGEAAPTTQPAHAQAHPQRPEETER
jgi:hypothetical protein